MSESYNRETLPESVIINQVEFKKTWNSDQTAFNFSGANGEVKSAQEVADTLNGLVQHEVVGDTPHEAEAPSSEPVADAVAYPNGSSDEALDNEVKEGSDQEKSEDEPADADNEAKQPGTDSQ